MRLELVPLVLSAALFAAEPAKPAASPLDGIAEVAKDSEEAQQATLDGGSTIGFIPLGSPIAAKTLGQYLAGFFRDEDAKGPTEIPKKAQRIVQLLPELKAAGATHLIALSHEGTGGTEYIRFLAIGSLSPEAAAKLEPAGWGKPRVDGSWDLAAFKDGEELPAGTPLPPLPIVRLSQMAKQLAAEADCAVDIVPLAAKEAVASYEEAVREAFAEEGQPLDKVELPAHARQVAALFPALNAMGASHVVVTAFQNPRGADIVLVVAKGVFAPEAQAKAKTTLGVRAATETTLVLGRWVDGEEKGVGEASPKPDRPFFRKK